MKTIYNVEEFVLQHLFFPFCDIYDPTLKGTRYTRDVISGYVKELTEDPWKIEYMLEENKEFKKATFDRLKRVYQENPFTFYRWINCPVVDYVMNELKA